jgi:hypothetical protein
MNNKIITIVTVKISLASCIPPGKLSEALDANSLLSKKQNDIYKKLKDN